MILHRALQGAAPIFVGDFDPESLPTERALRNHFGHLATVIPTQMIAATRKAVIWVEDQEQADRVLKCAPPCAPRVGEVGCRVYHKGYITRCRRIRCSGAWRYSDGAGDGGCGPIHRASSITLHGSFLFARCTELSADPNVKRLGLWLRSRGCTTIPTVSYTGPLELTGLPQPSPGAPRSLSK